MSFIGQSPGNILQNLYLKERLKVLLNQHKIKNFLEIGSGNGYISNILLNLGLTGVGIDLNIDA